MVVNKTGFTDLDIFDSTLTDKDIQTLQVTEEPVYTNSEFFTLLSNQNIIELQNLEKYTFSLVIERNSVPNKHSLLDYKGSNCVADASCYIDHQNSIGLIGSVHVLPCLQKYGYGTQIKKHVLNHLNQYAISVVYTYVVSTGGEKLADKTGFKPEQSVFPTVTEIWIQKL